MLRNVDLAHNIWCAAFEDYLHTLLPIEETKFKLFKRTRGLLQAMRQVALTSKFEVKLETLKLFLERKLGKAVNKVRQITALFRNWRKHDNEDKDHEAFWEDNVDSKQLWNEVKDYARQESLHDTAEPIGESSINNDEEDGIWCELPDYEQLQQVNNVLAAKAAADTNASIASSRKIFTDRLKKGGSFFYRWLKGQSKRGAVVIQGDDGKPTCDLPTLHAKFLETWEPIFNMHKTSKPNFEVFVEEYKDFVLKHEGAPCDSPDGQMLHQQAQRNKTLSAGGMDGITLLNLNYYRLKLGRKGRST